MDASTNGVSRGKTRGMFDFVQDLWQAPNQAELAMVSGIAVNA
jgi:hypothetical protein